jgi:hypothetical protein
LSSVEAQSVGIIQHCPLPESLQSLTNLSWFEQVASEQSSSLVQQSLLLMQGCAPTWHGPTLSIAEMPFRWRRVSFQ